MNLQERIAFHAALHRADDRLTAVMELFVKLVPDMDTLDLLPELANCKTDVCELHAGVTMAHRDIFPDCGKQTA